MDTLFDLDEPSGFDRDGLRERLRGLAARGIYVGGSSWKYEGWVGSIYSRHRYTTRSKFSKAKFEENCLAEYAETFPVVCGDLTFYQFPSEQYWAKLFDARFPARCQSGVRNVEVSQEMELGGVSLAAVIPAYCGRITGIWFLSGGWPA